MLFLLIILSFWGSEFTSAHDLPLVTTPRKTLSLSTNGGYMFEEEGVWNYSAVLPVEDAGVLILGARETILALDLSNITHKKDMVKWEATDDIRYTCSLKGKNLQTDCWNFIRIFHKWTDGSFYVCGTNAFNPGCKNMSYVNTMLTMGNRTLDGMGKSPFDPFQSYAYLSSDNYLYAATSMNTMGTDMALMRHYDKIRTTDSQTWFNDPNFIGLEYVTKGIENPKEEDDEIYLFFSEKALEYDSYAMFNVSRVARVCKSDVGGRWLLLKKWTTFQKVQLDCPMFQTKMPSVIKDVFHFCPGNSTMCVFYGVFTAQTDILPYSAVCAYRIHDIQKVFSEGSYKTLYNENSIRKWVRYNGEVPDPRPGACINKDTRQKGFSKSTMMPNKNLEFIRDNPLMDDVVKPYSEHPLLVKEGAAFTSIVVAETTALDGTSHQVMFIGTASGSVLKAVNYDGEMFIIEEVQLFNHNEPVKILRLSSTMGLLYAASNVAVAQMPLSSCSKYTSCTDCVLARDPYCGWDIVSNSCIAISNNHTVENSDVVQSLIDGNATRCPAVESRNINKTYYTGQAVTLPCQLESNLASVQWHVNDQPIQNDEKYQIQHDGLIILDTSDSENNTYSCISTESSSGRDYVIQNTTYELRLMTFVDANSNPQIQKRQNILFTLFIIVSLVLMGLVIWILYSEHFCDLKCTKEKLGSQESLLVKYLSKESGIEDIQI